MYKIENDIFILFKITCLPYAGWEKYSLECIVYDGASWITANIVNDDNLLNYWEDRKPVF